MLNRFHWANCVGELFLEGGESQKIICLVAVKLD